MIDLFLLTPLQINEKHGSLREDIIKALSKEKNQKLNDKWFTSSIDNKELAGTNLKIVNAVLQERNTDLRFYKKLIINKHEGSFEENLFALNVYLIIDEYYHFFLLYEIHFFELKINAQIDEFVSKVLNNRNPFMNLQLEELNDIIKEKSILIVNEVLNEIFNKNTTFNHKFKITIDSSFPLLFINGFILDNPHKIFIEEENKIQREDKSPLSLDDKDGYFHIGWNYGLVQNLSDIKNLKILTMMINIQMYYYQMRFYKKYFQEKIKFLMSSNHIKEEEIESFEQLKIAYYKSYLDYSTYKNGLFPIYNYEFEKLETFWHIDKDIEVINEIFNVQNEYMNKKFQLRNEKVNKNMNTGLAIIALLQIIAIYGVMKDFFEFKVEFPIMHSYTTYAIIMIVIVLSPFFLTAVYTYISNKWRK